MSSGSSTNPKYFLYIPVWATSQQPTGGSGGSQPSQSASGSESMSTEGSTEGTEGPLSSMSGSGSDTESPMSSSGSASASSSGTEGPPTESGSPSASGSASSGGGSGGSSMGSSAASSGGGTETGGTETGGTGSGGTLPSGTGPGGTWPGGTGPGGTWPSGAGSSNCLLFGTLVTLADGRRVPIELLSPGDELASLVVPGLKVDVPFKAQYEWMSTWGLAGASVKAARVASVRLGEHDGFYLINGRIKATFEHPFLIRRDETWGFCSAELLRVGDVLVTRRANPADADVLGEEPIVTLERIPGRVRTVALHVPGTNTYLADGVWTHNDVSLSMATESHAHSLSGSEASSVSSSGSSSASKSSSSSFSGSSSGSGSSGPQSPSLEISDRTGPGGFSL